MNRGSGAPGLRSQGESVDELRSISANEGRLMVENDTAGGKSADQIIEVAEAGVADNVWSLDEVIALLQGGATW